MSEVHCARCKRLMHGSCSQDTTNNPLWTGEKKALVGDDSRAAQFLRKYDNLRKPATQQK